MSIKDLKSSMSQIAEMMRQDGFVAPTLGQSWADVAQIILEYITHLRCMNPENREDTL